MRFASVYRIIISSALLSPLLQVGASDLLHRGLSIDVCGEVDAELKIPGLFGLPISFGIVKACLCTSTLPEYVAGNILFLRAIALFGKNTVIAELTNMVNECGSRTQCHYPAHYTPLCKSGSPCFFTCQDGYSAYPTGNYPTQCVCNYPYTECNGKCGIFKGCPSTYLAKRDAPKKCSEGFAACKVPGYSKNSWECVDVQNDLESCGGCSYDLSTPSGRDCSAIPGVSDVSCIKGQCVVHKCMMGYHTDDKHSQCVDKGTELLAAQYGLEHHRLE